MERIDSLIPHIAQFSTQLEALSRGVDSVSKQAIAQLICRTVEASGLNDCVVYFASHQSNELTQCAAIGEKLNAIGELENPIRLKYGQGIVGMVALFRKEIVIDDTRLTPNYVVDDQSRLSELAVPILLGDELLGVIDSEHETLAFFNQSHCALFQLLGAVVAPRFACALNHEQVESNLVNPTLITDYHREKIKNHLQNYSTQIGELLSLLDQDEFHKIIIGLLKNYHKPNALSGLPNLKEILNSYQDKTFSSCFIDTLKQSIRAACDELFLPTPKTQKFHYIIEHTYLNPLPNHQAVADHLGMSYSSFNRHLGNARREIASYLWVKLHKQNNVALRAC